MSFRSLAPASSLFVLVLLASCGEPSPPTPDSSTGRDAASTCSERSDCDDGRFCNGEESCDPASSASGPDGCVPGDPPCDDGCDESADTCGECAEPDADGDGEDSAACGGMDCDDDDPLRRSTNTEACDADDRDEDCDPATFGSRDADADGEIDDACCNVDADGDRLCGTDCDDTRPGTNSTVPEACDLMDNDCDGAIDERVVSMLYADADGDGFGSAATTRPGCMTEDGWVTTSTDCNDADPTVSPGQVERCNGMDDDCDTNVDEGALLTFYLDTDGDMYGVTAGPTAMGCTAPAGYAASPGDCDDGRPSVRPMADEVCDGLDTDCVGGLGYPGEDNDGDGHGDAMLCSMAPAADDCVDTNPAIHGGATELCDRLDNDCSSGGGALAAEDSDGDGHASPAAACTGGSLPKDDCDDARSAVIPGFAECATTTQRQVCGGTGAWAPMACAGATPLCDARTAVCVAAGAACGDARTHAGEECDDGNAIEVDVCDTACRLVPGIARPITPYAGSAERSRRPTFRVSPATLATGYEIALSTTRAFTTTSTTFTLASATGSPTTDLPVGRFFWRVRATTTSGARGPWSAAWPVRIGRTYGDLTGDGVPDWVAGEPGYDGGSAGGTGRGRVLITPGGTTTRRTLLPTTFSTQWGTALATGDLSCDGIDDLVVSANNRVSIFFGGAGGTTFNATVDREIASVALGDVPGDLDGDGCDDLVVVRGTAYELHRGGAAMDAVSDAALPGRGTGDLDGDGRPDVVALVGGAIHVHTNALVDSVAELIIPALATHPTVRDLAAADLDRDGYADLIVSREDAAVSRLDVYRGGATMDGTSDWGVLPGLLLRARVDAGQDVQGDGFLDLVACGYIGSATMRTSIYPGAAALAVGAPTHIAGIGTVCALTGDITGDGRAEIVAGNLAWMAPGSSISNGRAALFHGATYAQIDQVTGNTSQVSHPNLGESVAPH